MLSPLLIGCLHLSTWPWWAAHIPFQHPTIVPGSKNIVVMVRVEVKTAGLGPSHVVDLSPTMEVAAVRRIVAERMGFPYERLKLVLHGKTLHDMKNGQPTFADFADGDSMLAVAAPKAPPKHIQNKDDLLDDEDEELRFRLPDTASSCRRLLAQIFHDKLKMPDIILILVFSLSKRAWLIIIAWFIMAQIAPSWDLGPLYILATAFGVIFYNLGKREEGQPSAYSIFNEGFMELPGTLNADRIDRDLRAGQL